MTRNITVGIRMTREEKEQLDRVAALYGFDTGDFVRRMALFVERTRPMLIIEPRPMPREDERELVR
jgi:hypothetical protein